MIVKRNLLAIFVLFILIFENVVYATNIENKNLQNAKTEITRYPDYAKMYVGEDKFEGFNRKMFSINRKLNKYVAKPIHILWASIMPQYGMDRIKSAYTNIEYPKRLASCIIQKDGQGVKNETIRFLTNSTIGLGGLFDPAKKIFKVQSVNENMEQALCKCKMESGSYMVMPILNSCTPRSLCGRTLEAALDPSVYLATPITAIVKFGLMVNRTSYMQPLAKMLESTYADPYDIQKKLFGLENYIRNSNLDRQDLVSDVNNENELKELVENNENNINNENLNKEINDNFKEILLANNNLENPMNNDLNKIKSDAAVTGCAVSITDNKNIVFLDKTKIKPDLELNNYCPQCPIVDAMRTVFFENPDVNKSIWNELSIWNRSFAKKIKSDEVSIDETRDKYKFYYILQKNKTAPLIILFPSIGEGASAHHSIMFAKMFYDKGYSILMIGSHFQWQFAKSMPKGFCPGLPNEDVKFVRLLTKQALDILEDKNKSTFSNKTLIGTSFGALMTLFVANEEYKDNILNINKFIAISPPIELVYAIKQLDKYSENFDNNSDEVKHKTAITAAKILQLSEQKNKLGTEIENCV